MLPDASKTVQMNYRDDSFYISQVLDGNQAAFAALVEKHQQMVFTIAVKILRNREQAEEIAQDAFVKAYSALSSFKGEAKFSTWLYRIAYNAAISAGRRRKPEYAAIDETLTENYTTDEIHPQVEAMSQEEQMELIEKLMQRLPEEDNLLLTLYYKKEKSVAEVAEITGYSQSNVKIKLFRLRRRLYDDMQQTLEKMV
jgi:RNA polymerase sigma-70 factor (ECF subfamily)